MAKSFKHNGRTFNLSATTYRNNNTLALTGDYDNGDMEVFTVNLNNRLQSDSMAFLDINNHPWIEEFITENKLGLPMYYSDGAGFVKYPLYTIFTSKLTGPDVSKK